MVAVDEHLLVFWNLSSCPRLVVSFHHILALDPSSIKGLVRARADFDVVDVRECNWMEAI